MPCGLIRKHPLIRCCVSGIFLRRLKGSARGTKLEFDMNCVGSVFSETYETLIPLWFGRSFLFDAEYR